MISCVHHLDFVTGAATYAVCVWLCCGPRDRQEMYECDYCGGDGHAHPSDEASADFDECVHCDGRGWTLW